MDSDVLPDCGYPEPQEIFRMQKNSLVEARKTVTGFLGCDVTGIALMQSTSHSLGSLAVSLPLSKVVKFYHKKAIRVRPDGLLL